MQTLFWSAAVMALSGSMVLPPPAVADTPQVASTQVVNFSLDSSFCPQHGLYGIAHVSVHGTAGMTADQNFIWTTQTAATSIHSVPREGAVANVTVVYHCNVQVLWWLEPGAAHKVTAALWVKGAPPQPSYTIKPNRPASPPTPPLTTPADDLTGTPSDGPADAHAGDPAYAYPGTPADGPADAHAGDALTGTRTDDPADALTGTPTDDPADDLTGTPTNDPPTPSQAPQPTTRRRPHRHPNRRPRRRPHRHPTDDPPTTSQAPAADDPADDLTGTTPLTPSATGRDSLLAAT